MYVRIYVCLLFFCTCIVCCRDSGEAEIINLTRLSTHVYMCVCVCACVCEVCGQAISELDCQSNGCTFKFHQSFGNQVDGRVPLHVYNYIHTLIYLLSIILQVQYLSPEQL